jgi:hypothetical protein
LRLQFDAVFFFDLPLGFFFVVVASGFDVDPAVNGGMMSEPSEVLLTADVFTGADFRSADVVEVSDFSAADSGAGGVESAASVTGAFGSGLDPPHATHAANRRETSEVRITTAP